MDTSSPVPQPFLDWFGVWAGQAGHDEQLLACFSDPPQGIRLRVQPARKSAVFFRGERPWEARYLNHMMVLVDQGRYRMWYTSAPRDEEHTSFVCYAESQDGYNWERPELGLCEFQGSKANNIVADRRDLGPESVFIDPPAPPEARYKAIDSQVRYYRRGQLVPETQETKREVRQVLREMELEGRTAEEIDAELQIHQVVRGLVSPDGLRWRVLEEPLLDVGQTQLDTQGIAAYDQDIGEYVSSGCTRRARRSISRCGSTISTWPHPACGSIWPARAGAGRRIWGKS